MNIPFLSKKDESGEVYCGITLKDKEGSCILFRKSAQALHVLKQQSFMYTDGWEHIVDDVDEVLAQLEQGDGALHATQCIFFIFSHLIDPQTKEIAKPYITKMRDIAKFLDLKPIGYIEIVDAVHEYLEKKQQNRLSSLVIETDVSKITLFLYKGGHKLGVHTIERAASFEADVESGLAHFIPTHILPTHMYLYDSSELSKESTELMMHNWQKDLFMQQPRITVIQETEVKTALIGLLTKQLFGDDTTVESHQTVHETSKKEVMGFTIGAETLQDTHQESVMTPSPFSLVWPKLPTITLPPLPFLPILGGIIAFIGIGVGLFYFIHKAIVTVAIPRETKQETIVITARTHPDSSTETQLTSVTSPFTLTLKKDTTGKKDIGEAASGTVMLYGYEDSDRQLDKGTDLTSSSIHFITDEQVTIPASQFASDGITKNPGKAQVKVHAAAIGPDGNLEKNKRFSVTGISANAVFGINESALVGGTKKTVRTVAKTDIESIRTQLLDTAKKNALDLAKKNTSYILVADLTAAKVTKEEFSAEVGEEATTVTYKSTGQCSVFRIPEKAVRGLVATKLQSDIPPGYVLDNVTFRVVKQKSDDVAGVQLTIMGSAQSSKKIDIEEVAHLAKGMSVMEAHDRILAELGTGTVTIHVMPAIPIIKDRMPFWSAHIQVDLVK